MPTVLLTVDARDNSTAVLTGIQQQVTRLQQTMVAASTASTDFSASLARVDATTSTAADSILRLTAALTGVSGDLGSAGTAVDGYLASLDKLGTANGGSAAGQDALVQSVRTVIVALGDAVIAVDAYTAALARMDAAQVAAAASGSLLGGRSFGGGGFGGGGSLGPAGLLATAGAEDIGLGGRVGLAAAGGAAGISTVALAGAGVLYAGYKATQAASDFWSAVAQSAAQSGTLSNPTDLQSFGQSIIGYAQGGRAPYTATTLAQGAEIPLASGYNPSAVAAGLPSIAQLAAQNKAPDLTSADQLITTLIASRGIAPGAVTGQDITSAADFASKAEQLTKATPGALTTALPTLLGSLAGTGVSTEDATALQLKAGTINPQQRTDAQGIRALLQELEVKPTTGATAEANTLGIAIGNGSAAQYGGIFGQLQAIQSATGGNETEISKLLPQKNALTAYNDIFAGGGLNQVAGYSNALSNAAGTGQNAFNELSTGTQQQANQLLSQFNADLVSIGTSINTGVLPSLLLLGHGALDAAQSAGGPAGWFGHGLDVLNQDLNNFASTHSLRPALDNLWNSLFGGGSTPTASAATLPPLGANVAGPLGPGQTRLAAPTTLAQLAPGQAGPILPTQIRESTAGSTGNPLISALGDAVGSAMKTSALGAFLDVQENTATKAVKKVTGYAPQPFVTANPGVGGLEAGFQNTAVRFGSGTDSQSALIAKLEQTVKNDDAEIKTLLQRIADLLGQGRGNTARTSPLTGLGTNRSPYG